MAARDGGYDAGGNAVRLSPHFRFASVTFATAAALSGCGVNAPSAAALPLQPAPLAGRAAGSSSWMLPEAKGEDLLYVSDNWIKGQVFVFSYPGGKRVGTIGGLNMPSGECVDQRGDVWVVNLSPEEIVEYAHGGTTPIATLADPVEGFGCAIDPSSGDLAVASLDPAQVAVYKDAAGTPTIYSDSNVAGFFFCAYDNRGDLFVDSANARHALAELPKGGTEIITIAYPDNSPLGNMQWDGQYLAVEERINGNRGPATIDRVQIAGTTAAIIGSVHLYGNRDKQDGNGVQFWVQNGHIVEPIPSRPGADRTVSIWDYPAGGKAIASFRARHSMSLTGTVVSLKQ